MNNQNKIAAAGYAFVTDFWIGEVRDTEKEAADAMEEQTGSRPNEEDCQPVSRALRKYIEEHGTPNSWSEVAGVLCLDSEIKKSR